MANSVLPYQRLTRAEKIKEFGSVEEWGKQTIDALDGMYSEGWHSPADQRHRVQVNEDLINGRLNIQDFEHIVDEYRLSSKEAPNNLKNYPLVPQIANLLIGEKIKRPFNFRAVQTNANAISSVEKKQKELLLEKLQTEMLSGINGAIQSEQVKRAENFAFEQQQNPGAVNISGNQGAAPIPQENPPLPQGAQFEGPEEIQKYLKTSYQDDREILAQQTLDYLKQYIHIRRKFTEGFKDMLMTATPIFYVGSYQNNPILRKVEQKFIEWDRSPEIRHIEDSAWVKETEFISASETYDRYYDILTPEQIDEIEKMKGQYNYTYGSTNSSGSVLYHDYSGIDSGNQFDYQANTVVKVTHVEWKSLKKVGIVSYRDENNQPQKDTVDETYKKQEDDLELTWYWVNVVWEGSKVGNDIYMQIREKPSQYRTLDSLSKCSLGYVGASYDYCIVDMLKSYQYLYNVLWYRLEHAIAMAKGKSVLFDIAQMPKSEGFDPDTWMYYLTTGGIAFVNSLEEGRNGEKGAHHFNGFQVLDLTLSSSIQFYINLLQQVEDAAGDLVGVSPQRRAQVSSSELVGNVEHSILQSSTITEHIFNVYENLEKRVLERLIEEAKLAWREGKKAVYVLDDGTKAFLDISADELNDAEYGVFMSNNSRDQEILNTTRQLAHAAMQSGAVKLSDIVKIMQTESVADASAMLEVSEEKTQKQQEQIQQQQNKANQDLEQMRQQGLHEERNHELNLQAQKDQAAMDRELVKQHGNQLNRDNDLDDDGTPDEVELRRAENDAAKIAIDREKLNVDKEIRTKELDLKNKEITDKKEIELKKIQSQKNKPK